MHPVAGMPEVLTRDLRSDTVRRFALDELKWSVAPEHARREARERAAHVRAAQTGYRSGSPETSLPGELRPYYRNALPKGDWLAAKAKELEYRPLTPASLGIDLAVAALFDATPAVEHVLAVLRRRAADGVER